MILLLDTHAFIWWFSEPEKLSAKALTAIESNTNSLHLSVVSIWEMQIKFQLGKLKLTVDLPELIEAQERANDVQLLGIDPIHIYALKDLPNHHQDPFDRLLITQANAIGANLVSKDKDLRPYPVKILW